MPLLPYEDRFFQHMGYYAQVKSIPFTPRIINDYPEIDSVVGFIISALDLKDEEQCLYLNYILANMCIAHAYGNCVGIQRSNGAWTAYNKKLDASLHIKRTKFIPLLDRLVEEGFLNTLSGKHNTYTKECFCTRYWPTRRIYSHFEGMLPFILEQTRPEYIKLNGEAAGAAKNEDSLPKKPQDVKSLQQFLFEYCRFLNSGHTFTYIENDIYIKNMHRRFIPMLSAIYTRNSYNLGGRIYACGVNGGPIYQTLPQQQRKTIKIDDMATCEIDYSSLHLNMLYHLSGHPYIGDAYGFLPKDERLAAKLVALIAINAQSKQVAIGALMKEYRIIKDKPDKTAPEIRFIDKVGTTPKHYFHNAIKAFEAQHSVIKHDFFSDAGVRLQNLDAKIMKDVLSRCYSFGIIALPVHDSVICKTDHRKQVIKIMQDAYKDRMIFEISVK